MTDHTADEAKQRNIEKMGEALGTQFSALWQEVVYLHLTWAEYVDLFGTKPERITLLNRTAGMFFRIIQDELWEGTLLHLARLTDAPYSLGRKDRSNLSIQNVPALIDDAKIKGEVGKLVDEAVKYTSFARDWRNRHIAHRDLALAVEDATAIPLEDASRRRVKEALQAIANVLNAVEKHYQDSGTIFDLMPRSNGAIALLYVIDDGIRVRDARIERLKSGKLLSEDLEAKEL